MRNAASLLLVLPRSLLRSLRPSWLLSLCFRAAHAASLPLLVWPHILSDCLSLIIEGKTDGEKERNKRQEERKKKRIVREEGGQIQARWEFRGRRTDSEEERAGRTALGYRLRAKTRGNWETKSEAGDQRRGGKKTGWKEESRSGT